jgi:hypothetical protein
MRTTSDALSSTEVSNLEPTLSNDAAYGWTLTSNLRIRVKHNFYNIVVNQRAKAEHTKGKAMYSTRYDDQHSVEKAAFEFRYSKEACTGKQKVDDWLDRNQKLFNGDFTSIPPTEEASGTNAYKKAMAVKCSGERKKSLEMSVAIKYLEPSNTFSRNPSNRSNKMTIEEYLDKQATTIQKCLSGEALKRAAKAMRRLATDQSYRKEHMLYLGKSLAMKDRLSLLLGAKDPEIAATYTDSDKLFVLDKARHVHDALCIMVNYTEANKCII